jgi:peroxiredoxin Q/BCP
MTTHLKAGDAAPNFTKPSTSGELSLEQFRGSWLVLYFYPKDNTPGCTTQACDFRDLLPKLNAKVVGVSPDPIVSHEKFIADHSLPFPLISDEDHSMAEAYGAWGEKTSFGKTTTGLIRSTFIIDPEGKIAGAMYNVKAAGHGEIVERKLEQLQA